MFEGSRQLPLHHITIRIPWNDTDYSGVICQKPKDNVSCLVLPRIHESRDDEFESENAGKSWEEMRIENLPPCLVEHGNFMASYSITRNVTHPYADSDSHKHLLPTPFRYPPYSVSCIPFRWMLLKESQDIASKYDLDLQMDLEDKAKEIMNFSASWLQTKHNQLVMLDTFFGALQPEESLCFFYSKRTPLIEDSRRVIMGVGRIKGLGEFTEYEYSETGHFIDSIIWERPVYHSIREKNKDGFLFPYHEVLEYLEKHPEENPSDYLAYAPDDYFWSFSYASELLSHDGAVASILSCLRAISNIKKIISGDWEIVEKWLTARLNELWKLRGPYPGLGSALTAFGITKGTLLAYEIDRIKQDQENLDPWKLIDQLLQNPDLHPKELANYVTPTLSEKWKLLPDERRKLIKLLSRFDLSIEQATCWYVEQDDRRITEIEVDISTEEILTNPYSIYEHDRTAEESIYLSTIDRGLFPDEEIRGTYPIPSPSKVDDPTDPRRVRAFVIDQLERQSKEGHTLFLKDDIIRQIRNLDVQPTCPVDNDLMLVVETSFSPPVEIVETQSGKTAYQLERYRSTRKIIHREVERRLKGQRHVAEIPWRKELDVVLGGPADPNDLQEQQAREEKTKALQELFAARFSVLIGPAGTGKTTLLKALINRPEIKNTGVLLLAPTGKARVQLEIQTETKGAQTIAQFLLRFERFKPKTQSYIVSQTKAKYQGSETVIVDEASMLTEEQLAALFSCLTGVKRLILVGDHRQLPPIGAGRPFLDIVIRLAPSNVETIFPKIGRSFAELTVRRRQTNAPGQDERDDLLFADWFSGYPLDPGADEIWTKITSENTSTEIQFISWDTEDELRDTLLATIVNELELEDKSDENGFEISLGGNPYGNGVFFWRGRDGELGASKKVDSWQILSPVRLRPHGVEAINRLIQATFRKRAKKFAHMRYNRRVPPPMGREEILYGDKVIQVQNERRFKVFPEENAMNYVANGEIGIVVGFFKTRKSTYKGPPKNLEVEFSSQPSYAYKYFKSDFKEEGDPLLELAYALTVHKVQGSQFKKTILVLPNPCRLLSRELLYTALTRQENKVIILHQGDLVDIKKYSSSKRSETARRLTNIFKDPNPVEIQEIFLEENLIHRTRRNDMVRSKSEVIIADLLFSKNIDYQYEAVLVDHKTGDKRYPDFTFEDDAMGITYYWEHLAMLQQPKYQRRWERKLKWYRDQRILPYDEGGGENGTLITTRDDERGGIQSNEIEKLIDEIMGF
jgi:ATP-dependent exoDNAse (exonuclease V) alpha subunit